MNDSMDSGRRRSDDIDSPAGEAAMSNRPHLDKRRETLDAEIGRIIEESIVTTAHHEPIGSALEAIALKAFEKGCDQDTLIRKFTELGIFGTNGIVVKALRISIGQEIDKHYDLLEYDGAKGILDRERERLVNRALRLFLKYMGAEDCITEFFKNLIENRYKLTNPLLNPSSKQEGSVSRNALCQWALSNQTMGSVAARMGDFVKPVITEAYEVYIGASPDQYVRAVFNNVIGIDEDGAVKIYFTNMDELMGKVCSSIKFETFWDILMSHKDLLAEEYHAKFSGKRFYTAWVEGWKDYLQQRWNTVSSAAKGSELPRDPAAEVSAARAATAARIQKIRSIVLPPGNINVGGSGSVDKARVVLVLSKGPVVSSFYVRINGTLESVTSFVRDKMIGVGSPVAMALRSSGVHLGPQAFEIKGIAADVVRLGSGCKTKGGGGSRHQRKKH